MAPIQVQTVLRHLGQDLRVARKKRRLSVADFCARIGVTDKTLAKLERGDGGVRLETLAMALLALGALPRLSELLEPARDDVGLVLDAERLPRRIRTARRASTAATNTSHSAPTIDDEGTAF